jgi:hypothetical protein
VYPIKMKPKRKKVPSDYPVLRFTTTEEVYNETMERIRSLVDFHNKNLKEGQCCFRSNDIATEALKKGLTLMEKTSRRT